MDVHDIIKKHLTDNGYDGLVKDHNECGCSIADLLQCGDWNGDSALCQPGYSVPCDCGDECEYHIVLKKPKKIKKFDFGVDFI